MLVKRRLFHRLLSGLALLALLLPHSHAEAQTCAPQVTIGAGTTTNSASINDNPQVGPVCNYGVSTGPAQFTSSNATFINTGTITSAFSKVIAGTDINGNITGSNITLINSGTLLYQGTLQSGLDALLFKNASNVTVNNLAGGVIRLNSTAPVATDPIVNMLVLERVTGGTINNAGTITVNTSDVISLWGSQSILINNLASGVISNTSANEHAGIAVFGTATGTPASYVSSNVTIQNAGQIFSNNGPAIGLTPGFTAASPIGSGLSNVSIINSGTITGGANSFGAGAIVAFRYDVAAGNVVTTGQVNMPGFSITNSGLINGSASGIAIDNSRNIAASTFTSSGTIRGNILLGYGGDTLTFTGGSMQGGIVGRSAAGEVVRFNPGAGGSVSFNGNISGVNLIDFASGTTNISPSGVWTNNAARLGPGAIASVNGPAQVFANSVTTVITGDGTTSGRGSNNLGRAIATGAWSLPSGYTVQADLSQFSAISNGARYVLAAGGAPASLGTVSALSSLPIYSFSVMRGDQGGLGQSANDIYLVASLNPNGQSALAPQPQAAQALDNTLRAQTFEIVDEAVGMATGSSTAGKVNITPEFGIWTSGRLGSSSHSGYSVMSSVAGQAALRGASTSFNTTDQSYMAAAQLDVGRWLRFESLGWRLGLFGGFGSTDIGFKANSELRALGYSGKTASGANETSFGGMYSLMSVGNVYGLVTATGAMGNSQVGNTVLHANGKYETLGVVSAAVAGVVVPLVVGQGEDGATPTKVGLDLRAGASYSANAGASFVDTVGNRFSSALLQAGVATATARLFYAYNEGGIRFTPFAQVGYNHRFLYENQIEVGRTTFRFDDARDSVYASAGVEFAITNNIQMNLNGRGEASSQQTIYSGVMGVKIVLN